MSSEQITKDYLIAFNGTQIMNMYRADPKILENIDMVFISGENGPKVKVSIPKIYITRFKFFGQDIGEIGTGFADEPITFQVGLSPNYFTQEQLERFVDKIVRDHFYQYKKQAQTTYSLLDSTAFACFIEQYVYERSQFMQWHMNAFSNGHNFYCNIVNFFKDLINCRDYAYIDPDAVMKFNADAVGIAQIYQCLLFADPNKERAYYNNGNNVRRTYVIVFEYDGVTRELYIHDSKSVSENIELLIKKIQREAPRLCGMPDNESAAEFEYLIQDIKYDSTNNSKYGSVCMQWGLLAAVERAIADEYINDYVRKCIRNCIAKHK